jgi:hypothetical protein
VNYSSKALDAACDTLARLDVRDRLSAIAWAFGYTSAELGTVFSAYRTSFEGLPDVVVAFSSDPDGCAALEKLTAERQKVAQRTATVEGSAINTVADIERRRFRG